MLALLDRMRETNKKAGHRELAEKIGTATSYVSQVKTRHRNVGDDVAQRCEENFGLPNGWMDTLEHGDAVVRSPAANYDLVSIAETEQAMDLFKTLHPAFREYILMKMTELQRYTDALGDFLPRNLQAPDQTNYFDWERDLDADMKRLKIRDGEKETT